MNRIRNVNASDYTIQIQERSAIDKSVYDEEHHFLRKSFSSAVLVVISALHSIDMKTASFSSMIN